MYRITLQLKGAMFVIFISNGKHMLFKCFKFIKADIQKRHDFIKQNHLCFNCLRNHKGLRQTNSRCNHCGKKHHSLLHFPEQTPAITSHESNPQQNTPLAAAAEIH